MITRPTAFVEPDDLALRCAMLPLRPILGWAVEASDATEMDVSIDCDPLLHAFVDPDRLEQIVVNLVAAALEHGGAPLRVSARALADAEGAVVVVSDRAQRRTAVVLPLPGDGPSPKRRG